MKYLSYTGSVIVSLITIIITFAIFDQANSYFETIVFSLLILIYVQLVSFAGGYGYTKVNELIALQNEFTRIRRLLKEETDEFEKERELEVAKQVEKTKVKFWINAGLNFVIYLIVLGHLISVLI